MPLIKCQKDGKAGWKWGEQGKCYCGSNAKEKALKQGRAVEANRLEADALQTRAMTLELRGEPTDEQRSFPAILATESPVPMPDWTRMEMVPEVLLMSGVRMPADGVLPLLNSHQHGDALAQLGSVRNLKVDGGNFVGDADYADTADGNKMRQLVTQKHARQVSTGYRVNARKFVPEGRRENIAGRSFAGPVNVVTDWTPREVSMVPLGADQAARMRGYTESPFETEEEFAMNPELRAALVSRGMDNTLDDDAAQRWLVDNAATALAPIKKDENKGEAKVDASPAARSDAAADQAQLIGRAVALAMEEREKARGDVTAECKKYLLTDEETRGVCDLAKTLPDARAAILETLAKREHHVHLGRTILEAGPQQTEKHTGAMRTAIVLRAMSNAGISAARVDADLPKDQRSNGWEQFRYTRLMDIARDCLEMRGIRTQGMDPVGLAQLALGRADVESAQLANIRTRAGGAPAMHHTGSFPSLMLDAVNKTLLAAYEEAPSTWEVVFRRGTSVPDFKQIHRVRLGEVPNLPMWPDDTEPAKVRLADSKESYAVEARALATSFSYQSLINDDLDAFSRVPAMLGQAARRTVNALAWSIVTANPTMQDSVALFSAATGNRKKANLVTGAAAPTVASVGAMKKLMRLQVGHNTPENDASDAILNLEPRFLVGPAALENDILQLVRSVYDPAANKFQVYNPVTVLQPIIEPLLDANSATAFYIFAGTGQIDTIEVSFLQGQETPVTHSWMDDDTHSMKIDIIQSYEAKAIDFRGCARHDGV